MVRIVTRAHISKLVLYHRMEFVDSLTHCQHSGCGQGDFLPISCGKCKQDFCSTHAAPSSHDCPLASMTDMQSLECPLCDNSIKYARVEGPDAVLHKHWAEGCSQIVASASAPAVAAVITCHAPRCSTALGPSNTYRCTKCKQNVCLTHRRVEDHDCRSLPQPDIAFSTQLSTGLGQPDALMQKDLSEQGGSGKKKKSKSSKLSGKGTGYGGATKGAKQTVVERQLLQRASQKEDAQDQGLLTAFNLIATSLRQELDTKDPRRANSLLRRLQTSKGLSWALRGMLRNATGHWQESNRLQVVAVAPCEHVA